VKNGHLWTGANYLNYPWSGQVSGDYVYVPSDFDVALTVFDISDIASGNITHKAAITGAGSPKYLGAPQSVKVSGNYAYVASFPSRETVISCPPGLVV